MKLNLLCDIHWESRVDRVLDALSDLGYRDHFAVKDYGPGLDGIAVVLMCRGNEYHFKQRIRFRKENRVLSMDVMLDFDEMRGLSQTDRQQAVTRELRAQVPTIVQKYEHKISDFDADAFIADFLGFFSL